jgi:hypothetical protein
MANLLHEMFCKCGAYVSYPAHMPPSSEAIAFFRERHSGSQHGESTFVHSALARDGVFATLGEFVDYGGIHWAKDNVPRG